MRLIYRHRFVGGSETSSQAYSPVYTDDGETSLEEHLFTTGVTGYVGNSDGSISEIRVRIDDSEEEATAFLLSIDGGPEVEYSDNNTKCCGFTFENEAGDQFEIGFEEFGPEGSLLYAYLYNAEETEWSEGSFGVHTAPNALPEGSAYYDGYWNASGETETTGIEAGGHLEIEVDFNSGLLAGYTEGGFDAYDDNLEDETGGEFYGSIVGSVEDSELNADMIVIGDASGQFDLLGAFYGEEGEIAAGGIGGSLTSEFGEMNLGGSFTLEHGGDFCDEC